MSGSTEPSKKQRIEEPIIFTKEDVQEIQFLYNDIVVVSLNIADYNVCYILIDNKSSADVLFYDAFSKISIPDNRKDPISSPLVGFTDDAVPIEGIITLPIIVGRYP